MLSVQNATEDEVWFEELALPPALVEDLTANTEYQVTLTFVFVGGAEGTPVSTEVVTLEGGGCGSSERSGA